MQESREEDKTRISTDPKNNEDTLYKIAQRIYVACYADADEDETKEDNHVAERSTAWFEKEYRAWSQITASNKFSEAPSKQSLINFLTKTETGKRSAAERSETPGKKS